MPKDSEKKMDELLVAIDEAVGPDEMSKKDALEFLRDLIGDIETRCDALEEEIGEDG
jgi:hypothetical protein